MRRYTNSDMLLMVGSISFITLAFGIGASLYTKSLFEEIVIAVVGGTLFTATMAVSLVVDMINWTSKPVKQEVLSGRIGWENPNEYKQLMHDKLSLWSARHPKCQIKSVGVTFLPVAKGVDFLLLINYIEA